MEPLDQLEEAVRAVRIGDLADDRETVDAIGRITKAVRSLNDYKKALLSELPGPVSGALYRIEENRAAKRSYNTAALISEFDRQGVSLADLVRADVARVSWQWTNLKRHAYENGIEMRIASGEIEDAGEVGGPLVGETWETRQQVKST